MSIINQFFLQLRCTAKQHFYENHYDQKALTTNNIFRSRKTIVKISKDLIDMFKHPTLINNEY